MDRNKENILKQLKSSGPGFTVPKGYFKSLEDQIDHTISSLDPNDKKNEGYTNPNQKSHSSFNLDQIGKDPGFKVPEGYFDTIQSKTTQLEKTKVIPLNGKFIRTLSLSIAASILLFFGLNYMKSRENINDQLAFQDEEFINWIESDLADPNSYEIAEAFYDVELENVLFSDEEVDDYLNGVDIENLILEKE
jgi:hypothetical protein